MFGHRFRRPARNERAVGEISHRQQTIVHDDTACRGEVEREFRRYFHEMIAAFNHGIGKADPFHSQDVGGAARMTKTGQVDGIVMQFDADQRAPFRQPHRLERFKEIKRHLSGGIRGIGFSVGRRIVGRNRENEAGAEGMGGSYQIADIHRRASDWFKQHGLAAEALRHALEALEIKQIVGLVKQKAAPYLSRGELNASLHWLENLPPEMTRSRERLPLLAAWAEVLTGQLENALARLSILEQQFKEVAGSPSRLPQFDGEIAAIRAFVAYFRRDMAQAVPLFHEALDQLPEDNLYLRGIVIQSLSTALSWSGQIVQAIQLCRCPNRRPPTRLRKSCQIRAASILAWPRSCTNKMS